MRYTLFLLVIGASLRCVQAQDSKLNEANDYFQSGKYELAIQTYKELGGQFQKDQNLPQYVACNLNIAQCYLEQGSLELALNQSVNTVEYMREVLPGDKTLLFEGLLIQGESYLKVGRNDKALETLLEAEQNIAEENSLKAAECYNDLGVTYWNNQNNEIAKGYHEKALVIRTKLLGEKTIPVADSYLNLGLIYLDENFLEAVISFNNALKIYQDKYGKNHPQVALCYSNLAFANSAQSNFTAALNYLDLTMDIWNSTFEGDHPNKAFTLSNRGRILQEQGALDKALITQQEALQQYLRLFGDKHPEVANTYSLIGSVYSDKGDYELALDNFQRAIYANLYNQNFTTLYELPNLEGYFNADILLSSLQAKAQTLEALHFEKTLKPRDIKGSLTTYLKCDDLVSQIRQIRESEADKIRIGKIAANVYDNGIRIALYLSDKTFKKEEYRDIAFNFCERSKSAVLLSAINDTKAKSFAGIPNNLISIEDSLKTHISFLEQQLANNSEDQALRLALFEAKQSYRSFIVNLENDYPNYFHLKYQQSDVSALSLQKKLKPNTALVSYFIGEQSIYIFVVSSKDFESYTLDKPEDFFQTVNALRNSIKYRVTDMFTASSGKLYSLLVPKLANDINQLTIIPDGILGTIPFEALTKSSTDGKVYLLEKYGISYDYAASLVMDKLGFETSTAKGILLAAPITFEKNDTKMVDLPGSESEVKEIRYLFMSSQDKPEVFTRAEASEEQLKSSQLADYKYIHFATHGIVNESKPELSRIFLSPGVAEDGSLYSGEIFGLDIGADLVTLSACETGLGKIEKGEGIIGLSRSLMYAGAKNLIVSLWQVSDASTAKLMIDFYKQHLNHSANMIFADDLRKAKLSLLNSENYKDPYYWAPFILIGR
ncbi:MAG: CHAT domain-containing protein [Marinoscillum sp.]